MDIVGGDHDLPEQLIAESAYDLWEREGRPDGRDLSHWYSTIDHLKPGWSTLERYVPISKRRALVNDMLLDSVRNGEIEAHLASVLVRNGRGIECNGTGVFRWTKEQGFVVQAFTNGGDSLWSDSGDDNVAPGQLIPKENFYRIEARTDTGWNLSIKRSLPEPRLVHGEPQVHWKVSQDRCSSAVFTKATTDRGESCIDIILRPLKVAFWPRHSTMTDDNPVFGGAQHLRDWLQYESSIGTVSATKCENNSVHVRVKPARDSVEKVVPAIVMAFSFLTGQNTNPKITDAAVGGQKKRIFDVPWSHERCNRFLRPLGAGASGCEEALLGSCTTLFASEWGQAFSNFLETCLDSLDNGFTARALIFCSCVEGMVKKLGSKNTQEPIDPELNKAVLEIVRNYDEDETLEKRFEGMMNSMGSVRVKDILLRWSESGVLGITNDDYKSWDRLRNDAAHGKNLMSPEMSEEQRQQRFTDLDRMQILINKLILQAANYSDRFLDRSTGKFISFPLVKDGDL